MNMYFFKKSRGKIRRCYRKLFHKEWDVVEHGLDFFQEFADIYGDRVNNIDMAEKFFNDFMKQTGGWVIVDFLDTDNWDCIKTVDVDKKNGLIWFYWQIPSDDSIEEAMHRMVFPLGYYGMCLKFDNVRFIKDKYNKCLGITVNGYTIIEKKVNVYAKDGGWVIKGIDAKSRFFSTDVVREKDGVFQHWSFMSTPISSFWIIPKHLYVNPQDSEKLLYLFGTEKCERNLKAAFERIKGIDKLIVEKQRTEIKNAAQSMRIVAESLFKLIRCFYPESYHNKENRYDRLMLGKLTESLKNTVYKQDFEKVKINEIETLANDLSHDSGNPVNVVDLAKIFTDITYFIIDFKSRIARKGNEIIEPHSKGPSPHDFVKEKYDKICFIDEINETVHQSTGKISFKIKSQVGTFINVFGKKDEEVLCQDGYIRNAKEDGIVILKVWDRNEVIALLDKMYKKVTAECKTNGYDTETYSLGISFDAKLKKEGNPSHLFTEDEIKDLMRNADDEKNNKLVIDEDGYAHIIQNIYHGGLYPVSKETWCAGNMYVGKKSRLSDLHDSYVLCMNLWLLYLKTGDSQYDDLYMSDDGLGKVIEEVGAYYST